MPEFVCRVATPTGRGLRARATSPPTSRRCVASWRPGSDDPGRPAPQPADAAVCCDRLRIKGSVSAREFLLFNQELSALIRAGLPIVPSLDILLERRKNKTFRNALIDIRDRVKSGEALSEAFAAQGDMFPPLYSASLASGERSGRAGLRARPASSPTRRRS